MNTELEELRPKDNCPKCGATDAFCESPRYREGWPEYLAWNCYQCGYITTTLTLDNYLKEKNRRSK